MVEVLSNLQFNFHHILPLESLSKWLKPYLIETEKMIKSSTKLTKSTKIARTQSSTMDQSLSILHQLVKTNQKLPKIYQN